MMQSEYRREHVQLLKIDFFTRDPPHDSDKNHCPVSIAESRVKKERLVAQLFEKLLKVNVRKQTLRP